MKIVNMNIILSKLKKNHSIIQLKTSLTDKIKLSTVINYIQSLLEAIELAEDAEISADEIFTFLRTQTQKMNSLIVEYKDLLDKEK